jgi:hypothetical protein
MAPRPTESPATILQKPPCPFRGTVYDSAMRSRSGIGKKRRRFNRKYDVIIIVGLMIVLTVVVVGFLMYMLTSSSWRTHY